jgi:flavin reductase (DIM6/NTAB) family NADH-FMN oxidoreductase RutF
VEIIDIEDSIRCIYPMRTYLLTALDKNGKTNIITVDWLTVLSRKPSLIGVSISPKRYSHKLIMSSKEFIINVPDISMANETLACGKLSGETFDKFKKLRLKKSPSRTLKTLIIKDCVAFVECKVKDFKKYGDHTLFVGSIQASYAKEGFLKEFKPILHMKGSIFTTTSGKIVKAKSYQS